MNKYKPLVHLAYFIIGTILIGKTLGFWAFLGIMLLIHSFVEASKLQNT